MLLKRCGKITFDKYRWKFLLQGKRYEIEQHIQEEEEAHLRLVASTINDRNTKCSSLRQTILTRQEAIDLLVHHLNELESQQREQEAKRESQMMSLENGTANITTKPEQSSFEHFSHLESKSTTVAENAKAAKQQAGQVQRQFSMMSMELSMTRSSLANRSGRISDLECASYDGVFIWKLNWDQAFAEAKSGMKVMPMANLILIKYKCLIKLGFSRPTKGW